MSPVHALRGVLRNSSVRQSRKTRKSRKPLACVERLEERRLLTVTYVSISPTTGAVENQMLTETFSANLTGPGAAVTQWTIDWGDGSADTTITGGSLNPTTSSHLYSGEGPYSLTAVATDGYQTTINGVTTTVTSTGTGHATISVSEVPTVTQTPVCIPCIANAMIEALGAMYAQVKGLLSSGFGSTASASATPGPTARPDLGFGPGNVDVGGVISTQSWDSPDPDFDGDAATNSGPAMPNDYSSDIPHLVSVNSGGMIGMVSGAQALWFPVSGSAYSDGYGYGDTLTPDTTHHELIMTTPQGWTMTFDDFSHGAMSGTLQNMTDAYGNSTTAYYASNQLTDVENTYGSGGSAVSQDFHFNYTSPAPNSGLPSSVVLNRSVGGGSYAEVDEVDYIYDTSSDNDGAVGDLQMATLRNYPTGPALQTQYFRYWEGSDGNGIVQPTNALKMVFDGPSYARAAASLSSGTLQDVTAADDSTIENYADEYLDYNAAGQVASAVNGAQGCSCSGVGSGTYEYTYTTNPHGASPTNNNYWFTKVNVTLPDDSQQDDYFNYNGQEMLSVVDDTHGHLWGTFTEFNSAGQPILEAQPSAVSIPSLTTIQAYNDLLHSSSGNYQYLNDSTGLIQTQSYFSGTTTATSSTPGNVNGYISDTYVQQGETGTAVHQENRQYYALTDTAGATIYPIGSDTVYGTSAGGDARTTGYSYTLYSGTVGIESMTTTLPSVSSTQNGSGSSNSEVDFYDTLGEPIWTKDAAGHVNYAAYDVGTGSLIESIADVNYSSLTSAQQTSFGLTGWTHPTGGLNLVTTMQVDGLGRTTEETDPNSNETYTVYLDASHETRVYPGWHYDSGSGQYETTGPIEVSREFWPTANQTSEVLYDETLTSSAVPASSSGVPTGGETINENNIQSLSRDITDDTGQVIESDSYFSMSGITYSQTAEYLGSISNDSSTGNYYADLYHYDDRGRQDLVMAHAYTQSDPWPTATVTYTGYDVLSRVYTIWEGTNATPGSGDDDWSPTNQGTGSNMVDVQDNYYDSTGTTSGIGDGNLTFSIQHPDSTAADDRVTQNLYDFRDRLVASKSGVLMSSGSPNPSGETDGVHRPIVYSVLDNLDEVTRVYQYDGDTVSLADFATAAATDQVPTVHMGVVRALGITSFDDRGRVYQSQTMSVDQANGLTSGGVNLSDSAILALPALATNDFYDQRGNLVAVYAPGGLVTKDAYDGADRLVTESQTDGGAVNGAAMNWTNANTTANDLVLSQTVLTLDGDGNTILTATKERFDNDPTTSSGEGDVGGPTSGNLAARVYYVANYYDAANRLTDSVDLGTNAAVTYTPPSPAQLPGRNVFGTASSSGTTTTLIDASLGQSNGFYIGYKLSILGGTDSGSTATVTGYSASTGTLTITPALPSATDTTTVYSLIPGAVTGTASGGSTTTLVDSTLSQPGEMFVGWTLSITGGTDSGKSATVTDYNATSHTLTFSPAFPSAIDSTSVYSLTLPALLNHTDYNPAGFVADTIDPRGIVNRSLYDMLHRTTSTIDDYTNGTPTNNSNQTTNWTYNGSDEVLTMKAVLPSSTFQTTAYAYGVGSSGNLYSNDLLATIEYPDKSTGNPSTAAADDQSFTYNNLGQKLTFDDHYSTGAGGGSVHGYVYDVLGRETLDKVTSLGTGVDGSVMSHAWAFDGAGRLSLASADSDTNPPNSTNSNVVNQDEYVYNGLSQLVTEYEARTGAVSTTSPISPNIQWTYNLPSSTSNNDRELSMTYPNGRVLDYLYGLAEYPLTQITYSGTTATATMGSNVYNVGDSVTISGATPAVYDGTFTVTAVDTVHDTFSYTMSSNPGINASGADLIATTPATTLDDKISRVTALMDHGGTSAGKHLEEYTYLGLSTIVVENRPEDHTQLTYIKVSGDSSYHDDGGDGRYTGLDRFGRVDDQFWLNTGTGGGAVDRLQIGYDRDNNVLYENNLVNSADSELFHANAAASGDDNSAYDGLNRIQAFARGTLSASSYNGGVLDTITSPSGSQTYTLDAVGNFSSITDSSLGTQSRTANAQNQVATISGDSLGGVTAVQPTYDNAGNTTRNDTGNYLVYDAWNAVTAVKDTSDSSTLDSFTHDANGQIATSGGGTNPAEWFYTPSGRLIETWYPVSGIYNQYVWGEGYVNSLILRDRNYDGNLSTGSYGITNSGLEERVYANQDANYNVLDLLTPTSSAQTVDIRYVYDAYGKPTTLNSTWGTYSDPKWYMRILFQGEYWENNSSSYIMGARFYSYTLGAWFQKDPIGTLDGPNVYQFVHANPANHKDPLGLHDPIFYRQPSDDDPGVLSMKASAAAHDAAVDAWARVQKAKVAAALTALCAICKASAGVGSKCTAANCAKQAVAIADAIVDAIANHRKAVGFDQWGGLASNLTPGEFACGDWQQLTGDAADGVNLQFVKDHTSAFRVDWVAAHHWANHNWIEISCRSAKPNTAGSFIVIDPYPSGGNGNVIDTSSSSKWPTKYTHRTSSN